MDSTCSGSDISAGLQRISCCKLRTTQMLLIIFLRRNSSTFDLQAFDFDRPKKEDRGLISLSSRLWNYEVYYMLIEAPFLPALGNLVMLRGMIDKTDVQPKESIIFDCANFLFYE